MPVLSYCGNGHFTLYKLFAAISIIFERFLSSYEQTLLDHRLVITYHALLCADGR